MDESNNFNSRMSSGNFHPSIHLFTNYWSESQITGAGKAIKKIIFGDENADTFYEGPKGSAQMSIQTEITLTEFSQQSSVSKALAILDTRLDALFNLGFCVHLLLPVHDMPVKNWLGIDWVSLKANWPGAVFDPYQPFEKKSNNSQTCAYDIISENFHKPIIQHLYETGKISKLAVIYLMNEFGYPSNTILDSAKNWNDSPNWMRIRAKALKNTAKRVLENGRKYANGSVPVGLKFAAMTSPNTGWTPSGKGDRDQLKSILKIMSERRDVFAYDLYFSDSDDFDMADRQRIAPFLDGFSNGYFEISESGHICRGQPGQFLEGSRTSDTDIIETCNLLPQSTGYNLFAWNACGTDQGCYAIADENNMPFSGSDNECSGILDLIKRATGNEKITGDNK